MSDEVSVATDGVTVVKSYESEKFPVPAIAFEISSDREDAVALVLTDEIPDEFTMDRIGFHPDYDSDNWTAYQDQRVRYARTLEAGAAVTTVYGIRLDDEGDSTAFLDEPAVDVTPLDEVDEDADRPGVVVDESDLDDIVPAERTAVVREAIAEDEPVPGLDDGPADDGAADVAVTEAPADGDDDAVAADDATVDPLAGVGTVDDVDDEPPQDDVGDEGTADGIDETDELEVEGTAGDDPAVSADPLADESEPVDGTDPLADESESPDAGTPADEADAADDASPEPADLLEADSLDGETTPGPDEQTGGAVDDAAEIPGGGVADRPLAATLAAEIRAGEVAEEDLTVLRDALGGESGGDRAEEVRLDHLQARVSDLEAYTDALESFIDGTGTARDLLDGVQDDVSALAARTDDVEAAVDRAGRDRSELQDALDDLAVGEDALTELEADVDRLRADLDALDERVAGVEDAEARLEDLRADVDEDVDSLHDDIEELREWRDQLTNVFGG